MIQISRELKPVFQASKWQVTQALIDSNELEDLFSSLKKFWMVKNRGLLPKDQVFISLEEFKEAYVRYLSKIKRGEVSDEEVLTSIWSEDLSYLWLYQMEGGKVMTRISKPVVQVVPFHFSFSKNDLKIYPMVFGKESIPWGLQFSYPQLYQDPDTHDVENALNSSFVNAGLFKTLRSWMRAHTKMVSFEFESQSISSPMRLGLNCFTWIENHPSLIKHGLSLK